MNRWNLTWRLSWCVLLFTTASNFWWRLEPSHRTILGWLFLKCSYFLKRYCKYVFRVSPLSIAKKEIMWLSHASFAFTNSFFFFNFLFPLKIQQTTKHKSFLYIRKIKRKSNPQPETGPLPNLHLAVPRH